MTIEARNKERADKLRAALNAVNVLKTELETAGYEVTIQYRGNDGFTASVHRDLRETL